MFNKTVLVFAALFVIFVASLYFCYFYIQLDFVLSDNREDWAQFGDYFGGILNPILSFFAIIFLIKSIDMQMQANRVLKEEIEESKKNEKIKNF